MIKDDKAEFSKKWLQLRCNVTNITVKEEYTGTVTAGSPRKFPAMEYRISAAELMATKKIRFYVTSIFISSMHSLGHSHNKYGINTS